VRERESEREKEGGEGGKKRERGRRHHLWFKHPTLCNVPVTTGLLAAATIFDQVLRSEAVFASMLLLLPTSLCSLSVFKVNAP